MTNYPNNATFYTVLNRGGEMQDSGCTIEQAAHVIMNYDGGEYDIRPMYVSGAARFDDLDAAKAHQAENVGYADAEERADVAAQYEPRPEGYRLWTRKQVANRRLWGATFIFSLETDRSQAEAEIYREVVEYAPWWGGLEVMSDVDYEGMLAEQGDQEE
jgi:hypothetical protein